MVPRHCRAGQPTRVLGPGITHPRRIQAEPWIIPITAGGSTAYASLTDFIAPHRMRSQTHPKVLCEVLKMPSRSAPFPGSVGRFVVQALLGSGGMGEVYKRRSNTANSKRCRRRRRHVSRDSSADTASGRRDVHSGAAIRQRCGRDANGSSLAPTPTIVSYEGRAIFDSGCTSAAAAPAISYAGRDTGVTVQVMPNCAGGSGARWEYRLSCPR